MQRGVPFAVSRAYRHGYDRLAALPRPGRCGHRMSSVPRARKASLRRLMARSVSSGPQAGQDGAMRDTRTTAVGLRSAIERSGYYPGLVADAVFSALGAEAVVSYVVQSDALLDRK